MKKFKKVAAVVLSASIIMGMLTACGGKAGADDKKSEAKTGGKIAMVTDVGGIKDESFNQSAWEGLEELKEEDGVEISYVESHKATDYSKNLETKINEGNDLIWGIGFLMKGDVEKAALDYPEQYFALVDDKWEDGKVPNTIGIEFAAEQSSFLVGYIASYMTKTDKVGFVLGMESPTMLKFKYGYLAGVKYGATEQGKTVDVASVTIESFDNAALGKATANKMFSDGADIVFHAAGGAGIGVIDAAKDAGKFAIGVDKDQNYLAEDTVITSAVKNVNIATKDISKKFLAGEELGGTTVYYDLKSGGVGIAESSSKHVPKEVLDKEKEVEDKIIKGDIKVPVTEEEYNNFK